MSPRPHSRALAVAATALLTLTATATATVTGTAATPAFAQTSIAASDISAPSLVSGLRVTMPQLFVAGETQRARVSTIIIKENNALVGTSGPLTFTDEATGRSYGTFYVRGNDTIPFGSTLAAGTHQILATFSPAGATPSYNRLTLQVLPAPQLGESVDAAATSSTSLNVQSSPVAGEPFDVEARVQTEGGTPADGEVVLLIDGVEYGRAPLDASGEVTLLPAPLTAAGVHTAQVVYLGSEASGISGSSTAVTDFTVEHADARVELAADAGAVAGQLVEFSVRVAPTASNTETPSGLVYLVGATADGDAELGGYGMLDESGVATFVGGFVTPGIVSVTARYAGDDSFDESVSAERPFELAPASTLTTLAADATQTGTGDGIDFTAQIGLDASSNLDLTGTLEFLVDGVSILTQSVGVESELPPVDGSVTSSLMTDELTTGEHTVIARFTSNSPVIASSESAPITVTISRYPSTVGVTPSDVVVDEGTRAEVTVEVAARPQAPASPLARVAETPELPIAWGTVQAFIGGTAVSVPVDVEDEPVTLTLDELAAGSHAVEVRYVSSSARVADSSAGLTVTVAEPSLPAPLVPDAADDASALANTGSEPAWGFGALAALVIAAGAVLLRRARRLS